MRFKRRKLEAVPPYVSMADIAFNLVLFFLILAKTETAADDSHIHWEPAKAKGTKNVGTAKLSITVDTERKMYFNGEQVGKHELESKLAEEMKTRKDKPAAERTVLLKIHEDTPAAYFEPIMEAVSKAGGEVVHVIDEEP